MGPGIYGAVDPQMSWEYCTRETEKESRYKYANEAHMCLCRFNLTNGDYSKRRFEEYAVFSDDACVVLWDIKVERLPSFGTTSR